MADRGAALLRLDAGKSLRRRVLDSPGEAALASIEGGNMSGATRLVRHGDFVTREVAGETIVVPIRAGVGDLDSIYTLNDVGATIWKLIDGTRTADDIALAVVEAFEVEPEQARRDVEEFLASLTEAGMIGHAGAEKHR